MTIGLCNVIIAWRGVVGDNTNNGERCSEDEDRLEMLVKKAMSLRGAAWAKALGRRGNPVAIQGGHALATRLPRCARNDISSLFFLPAAN